MWRYLWELFLYVVNQKRLEYLNELKTQSKNSQGCHHMIWNGTTNDEKSSTHIVLRNCFLNFGLKRGIPARQRFLTCRLPAMAITLDCKAVPFFSTNQRTTLVGGRGLVWDARPRGTGEKGGKRKVPRGRASRTSRLPRTRVVRWLVEKKGTALQSTITHAIRSHTTTQRIMGIRSPQLTRSRSKQSENEIEVLQGSWCQIVLSSLPGLSWEMLQWALRLQTFFLFPLRAFFFFSFFLRCYVHK